MKRLLVAIIILISVATYGQEKKLTAEQEKLQKEFAQLNQEMVNLKAQIYDAKKFIENAEKRIDAIVNLMNEIDAKYKKTFEKKDEK
jgi:uncharacterized protein YlxW (UPF0749 family)